MRRTIREPSHRIYAITYDQYCPAAPKRGEPRGLPIGALLPHADGKGFDVQLETMPFMAARIVARMVSEP